jgi:hypothetical protein
MPPLEKPAKLKIDETERRLLGQTLMSKIRDAREAMDGMLDDTEDLRDLYEANLPEKTEPWPGCSNTCLPLIQPHVDSAHAGLNNIIFGVEPWQLVNVPDELSSEPEIKERSMHVENLLQSMLEKRMKFKSRGDMAFLEMLLSPAAVLSVDWREEYRTVRRLVEEMDEETGEITKSVKPTQEVKQKGPWIELVDMDNFVMWPMTRSDIEQSVGIGHRTKLTYDELTRKAKSDYFDEDYVDTIIKGGIAESSDTSDNRDEEHLDRANLGATNTELYSFWSVIYGYDANGDGLNEDCVFVVYEDTGTIVAAHEFPYWHGIRNYIRLAAFPRPKNFFGRSQPQILEHCQRELNAIHNQRVDANAIRISPMFKKRRSSTPSLNDVDWMPGGQVLVDDLNDIVEFQINPMTPGVDIEQTVREYAELADGFNGPGQGALSKGKRLATELNIANAQGGVRMADIVRRVQETVTQIAYQVLGLCYQFMTDEELALYNVPREDLVLPWEIEGHGNTTTANKMQRRQEAEMLYTMLQQNPFVTADLRRGYNVTKNLLLAHDIMDIENWIGTESEVQEMMDRMQQAQQQAQMQMPGATQAPQNGNPSMPPEMMQGNGVVA